MTNESLYKSCVQPVIDAAPGMVMVVKDGFKHGTPGMGYLMMILILLSLLMVRGGPGWFELWYNDWMVYLMVL